jgi:asparagine synthase (glutamine-hydrolysing)
MCGIGGIVYWDGREPERDRVAALVDAQRHRGPDGHGIWTAPGVALAHNRLAIIDLAGGVQPMTYGDGRLWLTYNGELYNFKQLRSELQSHGRRFTTSSDTEVVLAAYEQWGEQCLERFRGMFAFAIWDTTKRSLFIARDRLGIKPLFYCRTRDFVAFSSELPGVLKIAGADRAIDYGALDLYLHFQYVPAPYTIYQAVSKLPPAHFLTVSAERRECAPSEYWRVRYEPERGRSEPEWMEEIDSVISDAVESHLVSDVPFGAFLSGGIDSGVVSALMSKHLTQPVRTFTIGFDDAGYDERQRAAEVAAEIGASHRCDVVRIDSHDLLDSLIFKLARHYGEPFADASAVPTYCVSQAAASEVKMVLSGDGGDELFAGYNTYPNILRELAPKMPRWLPSALRPSDDLRARAAAPADERILEQYGIFYAHFQDGPRHALYRDEIAAAVQASDHHQLYRGFLDEAAGADRLAALQYLDLKTYLPGDILTKVDIAAMSHSLEVRVPLLDHHVVELAARIPSATKLFAPDGSLQQKYLLKKYSNRLLSGDAMTRPKQGFGIPFDRWFSTELFTSLGPRLAESPLLGELFNRDQVERLVQTPEAARDNAPRIWSLLFLDAWAREQRPGNRNV